MRKFTSGDIAGFVYLLNDLHEQATSERSHYYVGSTCVTAKDIIAYLQDRERILVNALDRYGWHTSVCQDRAGHDCNCGFDQWKRDISAMKGPEL